MALKVFNKKSNQFIYNTAKKKQQKNYKYNSALTVEALIELYWIFRNCTSLSAPFFYHK